ncbi:MAG: cytochrome P450 [Streptomycetaceae bacterium]|nr:cytochrome P450 [Streptomycetaceae bacterium]
MTSPASSRVAVPPGIDLLDLDRFRDGEHHEMFRRLRAEAPVAWHEHPTGAGFWNLTRHADVVAASRDSETFSSEAEGVNGFVTADELRAVGAGGAGGDLRGLMMLYTDPPKHTRYRKLVNAGFTPRMIRLLEQHLRHRAQVIVDHVVERGACDFVEDLAAELPLQAIAEIMGVPQEDRRLLFDWTNRMIGIDDPEFVDEDGTGGAAAGELYGYAHQLAAQRREEPRDDIVTRLINAEIDGDRLSEAEFDFFMLLLAVAGNETTRNTASWAMLALLRNPEVFAALKADPAGLMDGAVEEFLRWASPVYYFRRHVTRDVEIGGQQMAAGDKVVLWYISANRDESVFADPFTFDITRSPNPQVAFGGGGAHFCLGANLARMELRLIFEEIVERLPDMRLAGDPQILRSSFIGGVKHLPVTFTPGKRRHT